MLVRKCQHKLKVVTSADYSHSCANVNQVVPSIENLKNGSVYRMRKTTTFEIMGKLDLRHIYTCMHLHNYCSVLVRAAENIAFWDETSIISNRVFKAQECKLNNESLLWVYARINTPLHRVGIPTCKWIYSSLDELDAEVDETHL